MYYKYTKEEKMLDYSIQHQRLIDFNNVFGPFSLWALLPFKRLAGFGDTIFGIVEKSFEVITEKYFTPKEYTSFIMRFVQGLFPV